MIQWSPSIIEQQKWDLNLQTYTHQGMAYAIQNNCRQVIQKELKEQACKCRCI